MTKNEVETVLNAHVISTEDDFLIFNWLRIEDNLADAGATAEEVDGLTNILADEGWGGLEYPEDGGDSKMFSREELQQKLAWYREHRA